MLSPFIKIQKIINLQKNRFDTFLKNLLFVALGGCRDFVSLGMEYAIG